MIGFVLRIMFGAFGGCFSIPSLLPTIQHRLLDCISLALSRSHYPPARQALAMPRGSTVNTNQQVSDLSGPALVQLSLQTLARFNFKVCVHTLLISSFVLVEFSLLSYG